MHKIQSGAAVVPYWPYLPAVPVTDTRTCTSSTPAVDTHIRELSSPSILIIFVILSRQAIRIIRFGGGTRLSRYRERATHFVLPSRASMKNYPRLNVGSSVVLRIQWLYECYRTKSKVDWLPYVLYVVVCAAYTYRGTLLHRQLYTLLRTS